MYKIKDVQLLVPRDGYSISGGTREYNEIELLPSGEDSFNTVLQSGIKTRLKIEATIYIDDYNDYLKLKRYQELGLNFPFKDPVAEYNNMAILELGPAQKVTDKLFETDIVLIELGQLEGEVDGDV